MSKIRLILTVYKDTSNIENIIKQCTQYVEDIVIYDIGMNQNTKDFCESLCNFHNITFQYFFRNYNCINYCYYFIFLK